MKQTLPPKEEKNGILSLFTDILIIAITLMISTVLLMQYNTIISAAADNREDRYYRPVDPKADLIFGNPNADIFIVEYGDLECPHCRDSHAHIQTLIKSDWGISGTVAWVWRNGFHLARSSVEKAKALECVRLHAGERANNKAWAFMEESLSGGIYENKYPLERYREIAEQLNIPFERVETCRKNNEVARQMSQAITDIEELNITETPYIQFISGNGELLFESVGLLTTSQLESFIAKIIHSKQED